MKKLLLILTLFIFNIKSEEIEITELKNNLLDDARSQILDEAQKNKEENKYTLKHLKTKVDHLKVKLTDKKSKLKTAKEELRKHSASTNLNQMERNAVLSFKTIPKLTAKVAALEATINSSTIALETASFSNKIAQKSYLKAKDTFYDASNKIGKFTESVSFVKSLVEVLSDVLYKVVYPPQYHEKTTVKWISPNPSLKYNEVCFFGSHNSFSAFHEGYFPYTQQLWDPLEQLENGIRVLALDIWPTNKNSSNKCPREKEEDVNHYYDRIEIRLSHGKPWYYSALFRPFKTLEYYKSLLTLSNTIKIFDPRKIEENILKLDFANVVQPTFNSALETVENFLKANPNEIVTLSLENYVDIDALDIALNNASINDMTLKPKDLNNENPVWPSGNWPTIQWMIDNNKRLVIFNDKKIDHMSVNSKFTFGNIGNIAMNQYGEYDIEKAATEHSGSKNYSPLERGLMELDYFVTFPINFSKFKVKKLKDLPTAIVNFMDETKDNSDYTYLNTTGLEALLQYVLENGLDGNYKNRYPNFIFLDFVNIGNLAMTKINKINQISSDTPNRSETIFRTLIKE